MAFSIIITFWLKVSLALAYASLLVVANNDQAPIKQSCDLYRGNWEVDEAYPLYDASKNCPYLGLDCVKNGRPDKQYLKYRWKPNGCHLPRFDGKKLLERYKGKKIMFVGDSISLNMWQSLTCMLHMAVPNSNYTFTKATDHDLFTFPKYGTSIIYLRNRFLVDLVHNDKENCEVLKLDTISSGAPWKEANVLIFNTYHWWTHTGHLQSWSYYQLGNKLIKEMDRLEAFKIGLTSWAKWIDSNIDFSKTRVLYQGIATSHAINNLCVGKTQPMQGSTMEANLGEEIVKSVISKMRKPIELLDITLLTQLRIDGHPSVYTGHNDSSFVDCSHWCLPGAPDSWNEILYATLFGDY